jgi:hypothetical protein
LEKSLLGASVSQIVDVLSFGWYESIFQSYQATKVCIDAPLVIDTEIIFLAGPGSVFYGCVNFVVAFDHLVDVNRTKGEQSVGKSFALNHLADTSFAGSAMRTTGQCN